MSKNTFDLELSQLPTAFDDVIERLYEAAILHPQRTSQQQMDFTTHPGERKEQILYYLQKTILIERHAKLAKKFAEILLKDDNLPF